MPLLYMALGNEKLRNTLLEHRYDVNQTDQDGSTSLHWACFDSFIDSIHWLLEQGADVNHKNSKNQSLLFYAFHAGREDAVKAFISAGASTEASLLQGAVKSAIEESEPSPDEFTIKSPEKFLKIGKLMLSHGVSTEGILKEEVELFLKMADSS